MSNAVSTTSAIPVVILCGGMGSRLGEQTRSIPKPMLTIGGRPILWHLMSYYRSYGFRKFILCLGYKGDVIKQYFLDYRRLAGSFAIDLTSGDRLALDRQSDSDDWEVMCVETGEHAMTGARLKRIEPHISSDTFMLTYGDGLSNVDLMSLLQFHVEGARHMTVTGVHPPARFGNLHIEDALVTRFAEKVQTERDFINGGFFVCNREVFKYLVDHDSCVLEGEPLETLAAAGQLQAFRHSGFWQCMDTIRDREQLESLWANGAKWKRW
jgi:glucose-1-phosphate cytidylyltransferase